MVFKIFILIAFAVDEASKVKLSSLAEELHLNIDDDILNDRGFTPLCLAVMFGPLESVKALIEKVLSPQVL